MTLQEIQLQAAKALPELLHAEEHGVWHPTLDSALQAPPSKLIVLWKNRAALIKEWPEVNWPTEGLQVCHELEKSLTNDEYSKYEDLIWELITDSGGYKDVKGIKLPNKPLRMSSPSYQQRLEAWARVKFPERFKA